jgi:phosphatidyl-myo-inositol dimannoside synthase
VVRDGRLLLPTADVGRRAVQLIRRHKITRVIFGAMAPLALLAPRLRAAGVLRMLAISHGHEAWWAALPGSATLLRRMGDGVDQVSTISDYSWSRIAPALGVDARNRMIRLAPPIDLERFRPDDDHPGADHDRLRVIAVGRMVRQKGFDVLLRAWSLVRADHADHGAELVLVGDGPQAAALRRLADRLDLGGSVRFTGRVPRARIPGLLRSSTVFALPVRTRLAGLNPEGLGLGFLEAAASGLPTVVGRSGGAPETLLDGSTGHLVASDDPHALADRIEELLADPAKARAMGTAGREFVRSKFGTDIARTTLRSALDLNGAGNATGPRTRESEETDG